MKTESLQVDPIHPDAGAIAHAAAILRAGGLVAFPTETVYGLGAHALDAQAVARIFAAKGRPAHDPLIVHLAGAEGLGQVAASVPLGAQPLIARFWPGPLTLVLPRHPAVPDGVTAGGSTVAVRVPNHPVAHALLVAASIPVAAPSANLFSHTSPTTAAHVAADLDGRIDLILDGGPTPIGVESTVLDVTRLDQGGPAIILRPGGVTFEALVGILGLDRVHERGATPVSGAFESAESPLASPGLLERHYAPRTPLTLFMGQSDAAIAALRAAVTEACARGERPVLLLYEEDRKRLGALAEAGCHLVALGSLAESEEIARHLYGALRQADALQATRMFAREAPGEGLAAAVRDRMRRAADDVVSCLPL